MALFQAIIFRQNSGDPIHKQRHAQPYAVPNPVSVSWAENRQDDKRRSRLKSVK